jgi:pimeloyl-ACP methyl ester carboxylesterase
MAVPTHLVSLADGRVIAVDVTGPAAAAPVVLLHAAPGSRLLDPDPHVTAASGVRLLTIDRPGYGRSSPRPADTVPTLAAIARDLIAALEVLGIERVAVVGWSAGGRVGAAMAAQRPDFVTRLVLVGAPAPDDKVPWVAQQHRHMAAALRADPQSAVATISEVLVPMADDPAAAVASAMAGPADEAVLSDPARRAQLERMMAEGLRDGVVGVATDIVADQVAPWGFEVADITVPVTGFYGEVDTIVSTAHGEWYVETVAEGELRVVPGAGHLVLLTAWRDILDTAMLA